MTPEKFYALSYQIGRIIAFVEFWVFIYLRETHVIMWSWWWLVGFQIGSVLGMLSDRKRLAKGRGYEL